MRLRRELAPDNGADAIVAAPGQLAGAAGRAGLGLRVPHRSTVNAVLEREALVTSQPGKRPESSFRRFACARPRDCYQVDATGVKLAGGAAVVVSDVLGDCTRLLAACYAADAGTAVAAAAAITAAAAACGAPGIVLCGNGVAMSGGAARSQGKSARTVTATGARIIRSSPCHPQACGKAGRHHQTLKNWPARQDTAPATLAGLQVLLDACRRYCSTRRRHTAVAATPQQARDTAGTYGGPGHLPRQDDATVRKLTAGGSGSTGPGPALINPGRARAAQAVTAIRDSGHVTLCTTAAEVTGHPHPDCDKRYQGPLKAAA